jgi:hypothetical protein
MKHWIACSLLSVMLLSSGCDSVNQSQIQILPTRSTRGTAIATVPASERNAVKLALQQIAAKYKFSDHTELSLHPDILCDYFQPVTTQPPSKNPMRLAAWISRDRVVIDLSQKSIEGGEPMAYQNLRNQIVADLKQQFGNRVVLVPKTQHATARVQHSP